MGGWSLPTLLTGFGGHGRVAEAKQYLVERTVAAVKDRLTKEINYWQKMANSGAMHRVMVLARHLVVKQPR
jgi:hypothetical protein